MARGFREIGDLDLIGDRQKFILAIQQRELTAIAGGEFPDSKPRPLCLAHIRFPGR
jgi:hypothetical protein